VSPGGTAETSAAAGRLSRPSGTQKLLTFTDPALKCWAPFIQSLRDEKTLAPDQFVKLHRAVTLAMPPPVLRSRVASGRERRVVKHGAGVVRAVVAAAGDRPQVFAAGGAQ